MKRAILSELAEGDLAEIWVSIATDDIATADRFMEAIHERAQLLAEQPLIGRERPEIAKGVRSFPYGQYLMLYRPMPAGVGIVRVVHGARDLKNVAVPML